MDTLTVILTLLAVSSAFLHIHAEYRGPRYRIYLFKPLTMVFILLIAIQVAPSDASLYTYAIIAGLVFSLAGDIFLMLPSDRFTAGLVSFLIAHLLYITAFVSGTGFGLSWWILAPLAAYGIVIFAILAPYLGNMKLPVLIYVVVILVMVWQAWERWCDTRQSEALLGSIGTVLFALSDSALAVDRFRVQYRSAPALIHITYFAAQWLIALSVAQEPLS